MDFIFGLVLLSCVMLVAFAIINGVIALVRHRIRRGRALTDYETEMVRNAARRDAYEELARFAKEYYGDPYFSSRIRQLYWTKIECPACQGKGKKWQNSKWKCESCWGTGKLLKE
ncbi:MAG: hypothetical protein V3T31_08535 [candidate division Zixibacteria bacterium]